MKKILSIILVVVLCIGCLTSCRQASRVSYNISKEADNFNVLRKLTAINTRSDTVLFEVTGYFSMSNSAYDELEITCQTGPDTFKKHFVYVNKSWTSYVVEDISGADVSPYHFEINMLPQMVGGVSLTMSD